MHIYILLTKFKGMTVLSVALMILLFGLSLPYPNFQYLIYIVSSGGFRGGALGASAPPAESMVKIS